MAKAKTAPPKKDPIPVWTLVLAAFGVAATLLGAWMTLRHADHVELKKQQTELYRKITDATGAVSKYRRNDTGFVSAENVFISVYRANYDYFPDTLQQEMRAFKDELEAYAKGNIPQIQFQQAADSLNKHMVTVLQKEH